MDITLTRTRRTTAMHRMTMPLRTCGQSRSIVGQRRPHTGLCKAERDAKETMREDWLKIKRQNETWGLV